jgi:8-oxo-dGTP diphosphatase
MTEIIQFQSVGAILHNSRGQILLQQRDDKPDLSFAGCWTTLGGRVEDDETPDEAVRRELLEEIELTPEVELWKVFEHIHEGAGVTVRVEQYIYVGEIDREVSEITLNEGQALGFFNRDDIDGLAIAFGFESLFKEYFEVYG